MSRKKRRRSSGAESHERRQQRLEARREARARELEALRKAQRRRDLARRGALIVAFLAFGFWLFELRSTAPTSIQGHDIETFSFAGENDHRSGSVDYPTSPPVSGAHAPQPNDCGTHSQQIADEIQVHALEHGAIGIQFQPDLPARRVDTIETLVADFDSHVFSAPYEGMTSEIVVTSWGRMMRLRSVDAGAIRAYIEAFSGSGPEDRDCPNSSDENFEPTPSPSPS